MQAKALSEGKPRERARREGRDDLLARGRARRRWRHADWHGGALSDDAFARRLRAGGRPRRPPPRAGARRGRRAGTCRALAEAPAPAPAAAADGEDAAPPPLPAGWAATWDAQRGCVRYYNESSGRTPGRGRRVPKHVVVRTHPTPDGQPSSLRRGRRRVRAAHEPPTCSTRAPRTIMPPSMDAAPPDDAPSSRACASPRAHVYPTTLRTDNANAAPTTMLLSFSEMTAVTNKNAQAAAGTYNPHQKRRSSSGLISDLSSAASKTHSVAPSSFT